MNLLSLILKEMKSTKLLKQRSKNLLSNTCKNVPKLNLKVYAYIYNELIIFPRSNIEYETITTNKFTQMFID